MLQTIFNQTFFTSTLHASSQRNLLKPSELDIYTEPPPSDLADLGKPFPEFLYDKIGNGRKSVTGVFKGLLTTHEKVSDTYSSTEGKVINTYNKTLQDPYFLVSPIVIVCAAAGGAIVAGKGKQPIQRSLYSLLFGVTATAVCYPQRAKEIITTSYHHTASSIGQLFSGGGGGTTTTERVVEELKGTEENDAPIDEVEVKAIEEEFVVLTIDDAGAVEEESDTAPGLVAAIEESDIVAVIAEEDEVAPVAAEMPVVDNVADEENIVAAEAVQPEAEEPYSPEQTELKEVLVAPIDVESTEEKDDVREVEFDEAATSVNEIEGDVGQSNPEDADMYSTRS